MRFTQPDGSYVDLRVNKGIQPGFYQELVSVDPERLEMHFLAPVTKKVVATPDLE